MTYTAVNPHACCNRPRPGTPTPPPARHRTPTHCPTSPTATDCVGRLMAGRQQTAPPQQRRSKDDTAHPHQPGAHPDPPHPDRAHSRRHHPAKAKVKFPLRNRIFLYVGVVECAPASPYTYSSSTHRFPDERTPIEVTPLSATSAELGLGLGLGLGLDSHSSLHAPLLLATLLSHNIPLPRSLAFTSA
jgi:hypothetical protein